MAFLSSTAPALLQHRHPLRLRRPTALRAPHRPPRPVLGGPPASSAARRRFTMVTTTPSKQPTPSSTAVSTYDVVVIGGGPAGLSLAAGLGVRGLTVLCADLTLNKPWPNNYGTWLDELEPLALDDCTSHQWPRAAAYVHSDPRKSTLNRPYARVDRHAMKRRFLQRCHDCHNVTVVHAAAELLDTTSSHQYTYVSLNVLSSDPSDPVPTTVAGSVVVDATGHNLRFVKFRQGKAPGFQAAYGIECVVSDKSYPYATDEMLLMDFRNDHMRDSPTDFQQSLDQPTFLYVMPLDDGEGRLVFFEETSLVASPAMDFDQLKARLYKRLAYNGIEVESVLDEEFCLIPMGGPMPDLRQRVVAFGGAAALVHPATGYMIARALKLADDAAEIIMQEMRHDTDADSTAHRIWDRIWNQGRQRQRDFFNFGGEYLATIDLHTTREFFSAFFQLPTRQWADFLSFRLVQPIQRLTFGLGVFARTSNRVRFTLMWDALVKGRLPLLLSVLPISDPNYEE
uniref:lycopene beta-cyclase n=1 Tax=Heterosiphonia pulchra TaxID=189631 RepID=A0A290WNI9_9FLOR|nr:lycopene beta-cyclase [Heterosiphonia pulchra]